MKRCKQVLIILLLHQPGQEDDLENIEDTELLIGKILEQLEEFGDESQVNRWREDLLTGATDYTNRDEVLEWFSNVKKQHGPLLEGHESCIKEIPLFMEQPGSLPQYDTLTMCGWCTR